MLTAVLTEYKDDIYKEVETVNQDGETITVKVINGTIIGQIGDKVVLEVENVPSYEHEDITDSDFKFNQRVFDGKYGEYITYQRFCETRNLIDEVGDAPDFEGLLKKKIDLKDQELLETQVALVENYEKNIELEAMQIETDLALVEIYEGMVLNNG